jgi:hypothetical protein
MIPSRDDHNRFIRRIWYGCIGMALLVFILTGGVVLGLFLSGHDSKKVVEVSTSVFQVLVLSYGLGFFVPAFLTSLLKMSLGVEMSRKGLEIGEETSKVLAQLQRDFVPLLKDVQEVVGSARTVIDDIRQQNPGRIIEFLEKLKADGSVERAVRSVEEIAKKVHEVIERPKTPAGVSIGVPDLDEDPKVEDVPTIE